MYLISDNKARQTRFIVSRQPLTQIACGQVVIICYSLLANIHSVNLCGRVIAWKAIMTVEAAGLKGTGIDAKQ